MALKHISIMETIYSWQLTNADNFDFFYTDLVFVFLFERWVSVASISYSNEVDLVRSLNRILRGMPLYWEIAFNLLGTMSNNSSLDSIIDIKSDHFQSSIIIIID